MKQCYQCGTMLPDTARYCLHCGAPQIQFVGAGDREHLDLEAALGPQLHRRFFAGLRAQVAEEQPGATVDVYFRRLQECEFMNTVQLRIEQLVDEIRRAVASHGADHARLQRLMDRTFTELIDYFIIHYCRDINTIALPAAILKYQGKSSSEVELHRLILDYLDFEHEDEQVYFSSEFLSLPPELLRNAGKYFLFPEKNERIFFICDQSLLGNCREGFAFTEKALYWKAHLQKARQAPFTRIKSVQREKDWITINGFFFNVNPSLNVKVLKLVRKLKGLKD